MRSGPVRIVKNIAFSPVAVYSQPMNTLALGALTGTTKQIISMSIIDTEIKSLPAGPGVN